MKIWLIVTCQLFLCLSSSMMIPGYDYWSKLYSPQNVLDRMDARCSIVANTGDFVVVGKRYFGSFPSTESTLVFIRMDANGVIRFSKQYSEQTLDFLPIDLCEFRVNPSQETTDGFVIVGRRSSFGSAGVVSFIVSLDNNGNLLSQCAVQNVSLCFVKQTGTGDLIFAGTSNQDEFVFAKASSSGVILKKFDNAGRRDSVTTAMLTADSMFLIGTTSYLINPNTYEYQSDIMIVKTDLDGNLIDYKVSAHVPVAVSSACRTNAGFVLCGYTYISSGGFWGSGNDTETFLIEFDLSLNKIREVYLSLPYGFGLNSVRAFSVQTTHYGGLILTGLLNDMAVPIGSAIFLVELDSSWNINFGKYYDGTNYYEIVRSVHRLSDGGYTFFGTVVYTAVSNIIATKVRSDGSLVYSTSSGFAHGSVNLYINTTYFITANAFVTTGNFPFIPLASNLVQSSLDLNTTWLTN
ncbi:MAG: hypothetical protein HY606_03150 [Planctomycetes bacterium]|nr:hypothetical protein [Planctomycetota bacterium]